MAEVDFNKTFGWPATQGKYEDYRFYPVYRDGLVELRDGSTDLNIVFAEPINKLQLMLQDVEKNTQYSAEAATQNTAIFTQHFSLPIIVDVNRRPNLGIGVDRITIYGGVSTYSQFPYILRGNSGNITDTSYGIMCSANVYSDAFGYRSYRPVFSSVNITGDRSFIINVQGLIPFKTGDVCEFTFSVMNR